MEKGSQNDFKKDLFAIYTNNSNHEKYRISEMQI